MSTTTTTTAKFTAAPAAGKRALHAAGAGRRVATPPTVTRGESFPNDGSTDASQLVIIDWVNATWKTEALENFLSEHFDFDFVAADVEYEDYSAKNRKYFSAISYFLQFIQKTLKPGVRISAVEKMGGLRGYERAVALFAGNGSQEQQIGYIAWGGEQQRGTMLLTLSGSGCRLVQHWQGFRGLLIALDARLTRLDLALDYLEGGYTVEQALSDYDAGGYTAGGNRPAVSMAGDWHNKNARTVYIGRAKNGKMCRVYEKGAQLGDCNSPWVRVEVQFGSRDRVIPTEAIIKRDEFFAGAYPVFQDLLEKVTPHKMPIEKKFGFCALSTLIENLKRSYGKVINHFYMNFDSGDFSALVNEIRVFGLPRRLDLAAAKSVVDWGDLKQEIDRRKLWQLKNCK